MNICIIIQCIRIGRRTNSFFLLNRRKQGFMAFKWNINLTDDLVKTRFIDFLLLYYEVVTFWDFYILSLKSTT